MNISTSPLAILQKASDGNFSSFLLRSIFFPIPFRHQTDVKCFAAIINSFETHEAIRQQRREGAEEKS